jgi:hypothetical protein
MSSTKPTEIWDAFTTKAVEGFGLWAEANNKILRQLVDLSTAAATEGAGVFSALQATAVRATRTGQDYWLAQGAGLKDAQKDPARAYRKGLADGVEAAQEGFKALESTAETLTRSAERLQLRLALRMGAAALPRRRSRARDGG